MSDEVYQQFGDILHEDVEIEDVVIRWKRERERRSLRAAIDRDRKARHDAAWVSLLARHRAAYESLH